MTDEFYGGGKKARIKDEKWPAAEPETIHQDVRATLKPERNPHLGSKRKKEKNRPQTKRGMERNQEGDVIEFQCQICSSAEGLWSRIGFHDGFLEPIWFL